MNTLPFPPIVLTHITMDNALSHGACIAGIHRVMDTHQLSHLTAMSVSILLQAKKLTSEITDWIKAIAGLNGNLSQYGDEWGDGEGYGFGQVNGSGYGDGYEIVYGNGYGRGYKDGYGYGHGDGYGEGTATGDGYGDEIDDDTPAL